MTALQQWMKGAIAATIANAGGGGGSYLDDYGLNQLTDRGVLVASAAPGVFDFAPNPGLAYTDDTTAAIVGTGDSSYWAMTPSGLVEINFSSGIAINTGTDNLLIHGRVVWPLGTTPPNMQFLALDVSASESYYVNLWFGSNTTAELTVYDSNDEFTPITPLVNITRNGEILEFQVQFTTTHVFVTDVVAGVYDTIQTPWLAGAFEARNITRFQIAGTTNGRAQLGGMWVVTA